MKSTVLLGLLFWGVSPYGHTQTKSPEVAKTSPQTDVTPVRMALSELEQLKLDNLKLRQDLLQTQIELAQVRLVQDLGVYVQATLKAHGNPVGVQFNQQTFKFEQKEEKK
jgi:hypothetical protein